MLDSADAKSHMMARFFDPQSVQSNTSAKKVAEIQEIVQIVTERFLRSVRNVGEIIPVILRKFFQTRSKIRRRPKKKRYNTHGWHFLMPVPLLNYDTQLFNDIDINVLHKSFNAK